jgi:hypothetical protein
MCYACGYAIMHGMHGLELGRFLKKIAAGRIREFICDPIASLRVDTDV